MVSFFYSSAGKPEDQTTKLLYGIPITVFCIVLLGFIAAVLYKHKNKDGGKAVSPTIIHKMNEAIRDELVMLSRNSRGNKRVEGVRFHL